MRIINITKENNLFRFGPNCDVKLEVIEDTLCCEMSGAYIPIEDFIRL